MSDEMYDRLCGDFQVAAPVMNKHDIIFNFVQTFQVRSILRSDRQTQITKRQHHQIYPHDLVHHDHCVHPQKN